MSLNSYRLAFGLMISLALHSTSCAAEEIAPLGSKGVYRLQPGLQKSSMELVPPEEVTKGLAYNYYHELLGRRVWGFAQGDGSFRYAFGEGTILPTNLLDLRLSDAMKSRLLEQGAPGLEKALAITGGTPAVRLSAEGNWTLLSARSSTRIFDLATGHRWEWHGERRKAVLHTYGDRWQIVQGRYVPATHVVYMVPDFCAPIRAGSAMLVVRTDE